MNFQGLSEARRVFLFKEVKQGKMSLKKAGMKAKLMKKMDAVKAAFVTATNSKSWEYAKARYPDYTTEERLEQFASKFPTLSGNCLIKQAFHQKDYELS